MLLFHRNFINKYYIFIYILLRWYRKQLIKFEEFKNSHYFLGEFLPYLGYYYSSGPWKGMWLRLGYDPTKDSESRFYQKLDLRVSTNTYRNFHDR